MTPSPIGTPVNPVGNRTANAHRINYDSNVAAVVPDRAFFCPRYDECLETAAKNDWLSFSCARCPLRAQAPAGPSLAEATVSRVEDENVRQPRPTMHYVRSTVEERKRRFRSGDQAPVEATVAEIAALYGVSNDVVYRRIRRHGLAPCRTKPCDGGWYGVKLYRVAEAVAILRGKHVA